VASQNTKTELYPLRDSQPVKITEERGGVFGTPHWKQKSGCSNDDRAKSVQKVTRDAGQH